MDRDKAPQNEGRKAYQKPEVVHRQELLAKGQAPVAACSAQDPTNGKTGVGDTCTFINS